MEPVLPPALLYIFGAGHVAYSLYQVAQIAGFETTVIDDRESYANRERFPDARDVIAEDFEKTCETLQISEAAYIVIVTRGHRDDMRVLRWAVNTPARYVGMIGSRRKVITIYKELEKEGIRAEQVRERACSGGAGDWRHHAGGNRSVHRGGDDRDTAKRPS